VLAVMLGVMTAGLDMMMFGMAGMTVGAVGVVRRLLVIAGLWRLHGDAWLHVRDVRQPCDDGARRLRGRSCLLSPLAM
jgi:hypothetical protein